MLLSCCCDLLLYLPTWCINLQSSLLIRHDCTYLSCRHTFSSLALKELNHRKIKDRSTSPDSMPMKELIAVAQARRFSRSTSFPDNFLNAKYIPETSINTPPKEGSHRQLSPSNRILRPTSGNDNVHSRSPFDNIQPKKLAGHDEANAARRSFKDFLSTLTRTKESISRATRLAIECAKFGIAGEVRLCISLLLVVFVHIKKPFSIRLLVLCSCSVTRCFFRIVLICLILDFFDVAGLFDILDFWWID